MPLADRATTAVLTSLQAGVWTQLAAVPTPVEHGFDTLDVVWLCDFRNVTKTALQVAAAFPLGTRYGTNDFWLRSALPERVGGNVWRVMAQYEGRISSGKPLSVRMRSTNEVLSIDNIGSMPGFGIYDGFPANVREASPSVEIGYVIVGAAPPTNLVGLAGTPAVSPTVRDSPWFLAEAYRLNWPYAWVFTDVDVDKIAGASPVTYYCRESWQYFHPKTPA